MLFQSCCLFAYKATDACQAVHNGGKGLLRSDNDKDNVVGFFS